MHDEDLIRRIADGDRTAFETLYRRYYRRLYGFVGRWIDQPETVEEVIDDVLFVVWTDAARFAGRSKVSSWIFGIAHHQTLGRLRKTRDEASLDAAPEPHGADRELDRLELRDSLVQALESLSAEHRAVVTLTYYEGCTYREIADILDCPVNTVKTRMFYARRQLREALERLDAPRPRQTGGSHG